jgi:chemotaxis methyl-accepting protein methylase
MSADAPDEAGFRQLTEKIARERGFGCANYKDGCLRRRIAVRMRATATSDFAGYAARLDRDPDEWDRLLDALTINVTKLFRDAEVWESVARHVLPALWALDVPRLNVWSAGCASGEELYTLAALFHRHAERTATPHRLRRLRILGSDIDRRSIEAARRGAYAPEAFTEVPADVRSRYFSAAAPHQAAPELKALIEVERRDLLSDPAPPGGMHLITCRNVIIYFDRPSQEPLLRKFHAALEPGGFLVLGKVETVLGPARTLFEPVDARQRIFRRAPAA